ncbi:MAG: phage holin family protein [Acidimicrobiia bacterium]
MAKLQDLPAMITDFRDLAKEYLLQETVEPAKKLGHFAGFSLGAAALWALGIMLLGVAGLRGLMAILPDGPYWEALAYLIIVVVAIAIIAVLVKVGPSSKTEPADATTGGTP